MKAVAFAALAVVLLSACGPAPEPAATPAETDHTERAQELARELIIADAHIDTPYRLLLGWEDISERTEWGEFDYPRAMEGGLNLPFMSVYVPVQHQEDADASEVAERHIAAIESWAAVWPEKFSIATTIDDVREQFGDGTISLAMGMENGAPIEDDLSNVEYFYDRGIRYITLAHSRPNQISDSSFSGERRWNGLSPFGRDVVREMNRLGMMVDVSHLSDEAFEHVLETSEAPIIATHSSCRHFTPEWERNMSDAMIEALAENGGVLFINFSGSFLSSEYNAADVPVWDHVESQGYGINSIDGRRMAQEFRAENAVGYAELRDVADHIDHVVELVGIDHVGLGSDFDGVGDSLPNGLKDASDYPNLIAELLRRGYSEEDIEKICSGNLFRVWAEVERVAEMLQSH